ncbi:MAG: hypothetical protein DDT20_00935 [Firmicutes bacterium]|nr:hypothetical protein [Bacillota bacterium]
MKALKAWWNKPPWQSNVLEIILHVWVTLVLLTLVVVVLTLPVWVALAGVIWLVAH